MNHDLHQIEIPSVLQDHMEGLCICRSVSEGQMWNLKKLITLQRLLCSWFYLIMFRLVLIYWRTSFFSITTNCNIEHKRSLYLFKNSCLSFLYRYSSLWAVDASLHMFDSVDAREHWCLMSCFKSNVMFISFKTNVASHITTQRLHAVWQFSSSL